MGGVVGGAELARPPAGQGLALVAAGKEGQLLRIVGADFFHPVGDDGQRLFPFDFLELARSAFTDAAQRLGQPGRGIMLHDAGASLAAQHTLVDRVILIALDIADFTFAQVDLDAASAGAHITGGGLGFVTDYGRQIDAFLRV